MSARKISRLLTAIGFLLMLVSLVWWYATHSAVTDFLGGSVWGLGGCLVQAAGVCASVADLVRMYGYPAYSPIVFWAGPVLFVIGFALRRRPVAEAPEKAA